MQLDDLLDDDDRRTLATAGAGQEFASTLTRALNEAPVIADANGNPAPYLNPDDILKRCREEAKGPAKEVFDRWDFARMLLCIKQIATGHGCSEAGSSSFH